MELRGITENALALLFKPLHPRFSRNRVVEESSARDDDNTKSEGRQLEVQKYYD